MSTNQICVNTRADPFIFAHILTGVMARRAALRPSRATLPVLRSFQLAFVRMVGMVTFGWIASAFHASQRRERGVHALRRNHHRGHGEARWAAAIQMLFGDHASLPWS